MSVLNTIKLRRSIRAFKDQEVEEEKLLQILEAARLSPSPKNLQERIFIIVKDREKREALADAALGQKFVGEAPVVIAACSVNTEYVMPSGQSAYPIDITIALDHITLQAVAEGLGTCWIGAFDEKKVKKILNIPESVRVVMLLPIGYPKVIPEPTQRKKIEEITMLEEWERGK
ncbi:MAG: nitroreductase [Methanosarcinales archaeon]|uniref:Nitroreductase n=1 Tax=Candidatus Ethanoperedens thermophilum TaxID=2766897 RepID=A0A848DBY6_9EURY|nr:nitroreductase [Candidatus Ethanoperedens thermophilum]